jgi:RING finger/CHY zinc finger protein 1
MKQNCPICQENLFNSVVECRVLRCGHTMHKPCYNSLMEQARWPTCPLCSVSIIDSTLAWHQLDIEIANTPMPEEYRDQIVQLLCNDCNTKGEVPLHFLGLKCPNTSCGSYNTARL